MKLGERGQVTIHKELREKYGLFRGIEIEFVPEKKGIRIKKKTHHISGSLALSPDRSALFDLRRL